MPQGPGSIYLDNAATTGLHPTVVAAMRPHMGIAPANASSLHRPGVRAAAAIEKARRAMAHALAVQPDEIIFNSGGTEGNNHAIKGAALARREEGRHILVSSVEHPSVFRSVDWLASLGWEVTRLPVDGQGLVDPDDVRRALRRDTVLVSVAHGNHETGAIQPVEAIGACCREHGAWFHVDACQSFTRAPLHPAAMLLDLVTLNGHKIHGPKGAGAIWKRSDVSLVPLLHGGSQEGGERAGTSNTPGIVGLGEATRLADPDTPRAVARRRDAFVTMVEDSVPEVRLNGPREGRLCHLASLTFPGVDARRVAQGLDRRGIQVSTGATCSANQPTPSHVLIAMGVSPDDARGTVRVSLSMWTTDEELRVAAASLVEVVKEGPR